MKIKKLQKAFTKLAHEEIGADGYAYIESVRIDVDHKEIRVDGHFGLLEDEADGFNEHFTLDYPDGKSVQFVAGMLYAEMRKTF